MKNEKVTSFNNRIQSLQQNKNPECTNQRNQFAIFIIVLQIKRVKNLIWEFQKLEAKIVGSIPSSWGKSWALDPNPLKQFKTKTPKTTATILLVWNTNPILERETEVGCQEEIGEREREKRVDCEEEITEGIKAFSEV